MRRAQNPARTSQPTRTLHRARAARATHGVHANRAAVALATTTMAAALVMTTLAAAAAATLLTPRHAAAQTVAIDSVLPKANTVYGDLDPNTPGVQFIWCVADTFTPYTAGDSSTQAGFLDWFGYVPDNTAYPTYTEVRVDSATAATLPSACSAYQVGKTTTLPKGRYSFYSIAQVTEQAGTPLTAVDTATIDSVWLYPSPAHIAFANDITGAPDPRDTIYTANSGPPLTVATDLGPAQPIEVTWLYTPFGASAPVDSLYPWTAYTDSTGMAPVYGEFGFYDGDGIYTVIASSDSVPGTFPAARDTMVYIYTSAGLNMQVLQPDSGGVYPTAFEVYGKVAPGTKLRISCGCTESGDTTVAAADSTWTFGTVHFDTAGVTIYYTDPATDFFGGYVQVPFTFTTNQPPTATITQPSKDTTVIVGDTVAFSGTGTDPDGTIAGYAWDFGDGGQATTATTTHAYASAGVDTVLFRVTDNVGATSPADTVIVTVVPNQPPTATITSPSQDTTVFVGDTLTFNGTGTDPDDSVVSYLWDLGGGNEVAGQTVRYAYPAAGVDTVLLRVTDSRGATSVPDTVIVTVVANQPPTATITSPSQDTTVAGGDTITFSGTGTDPDGTVVSYAWRFGDGGQATGANATHVFTNGGTFTVTLVVTDDRGATSAPDSVHVTVITVNRPPTVTITAPSQDTTVSVGDTIHLAATAFDPDGDSTTIQWLVRDTTRTGATTSVVYGLAGTDTVQARAIDANGAMSAWAVRVLTVVGRGPNVDRTSPGSALRVDGHDVVFVIKAMTTQNLLADVNGDGVVNDADLQAVLAAFGTIPPDPTQEAR
jgi:PKD repeat protein